MTTTAANIDPVAEPAPATDPAPAPVQAALVTPAPSAPAYNNNLELHKGDNFVICLDISGSMQAHDCPNGSTRLAYTLEQFTAFIKEASKWDTDGVSIYAFGASVHAFSDVSADKLDATIATIKGMRLESMTMTHLAIAKAWEEHTTKKNEQTVVMVFTDGEPTDYDGLTKTIADITQSVKDEREFNIIFITVGERSPELQAFLTTLDDDLPGAACDIVDVKRLEEVDFFTAFDGALND